MNATLLYILGVCLCGVLGIALGAQLGGQHIAQMTGGAAVVIAGLVGAPLAKWGEEHGVV